MKNKNSVLCQIFVENFNKSNNFEFIGLLITLFGFTKDYIIDLTEELRVFIKYFFKILIETDYSAIELRIIIVIFDKGNLELY